MSSDRFSSLISSLIIPYIPALLIFMTFASYFEHASPYLTFIRDSENCQNYWWRNWLFINNLYPLTEMCYVTTWYLAADFQLHIVVIAILAFRTSFTTTGTTLLQLSFVFGLVLAAYVGYINNYSFYIDVQLNQLNTTYFPSWTRICPYLIGVAGALLHNKLKREKIVINSVLMTFLWTCNVALGIVLFFTPTFYREDDPWFGAFALSLGRSLWSFTVIWLIVTTALGYGGIIGRLFTQKWFIPISRISYSTCLVNQIVLYVFEMAADKPYHYDIPMNVSAKKYEEPTLALIILWHSFQTIIFTGFGTLILIVSLIFNLIFEYPFVRLMKLLRKNL